MNVYMYCYALLPFRLLQYLDETADNLDGLPFKLHDFGFRGSTSVEVRAYPSLASSPAGFFLMYTQINWEWQQRARTGWDLPSYCSYQ
jgi:hypothetical protein